MARLFVGNFEFEHSLADPGFYPSRRLQELNAALAGNWRAIAEHGDFVWCPVPETAHTWAEQSLPELPQVHIVNDLAGLLPDDLEFVPWGWTEAWRTVARNRHWRFQAPPLEIVKTVNSRQFSFDLECEWRTGLPGAGAVRQLVDLDSALTRAREVSPRAVLKANWGMSGRERRLIPGPLTETDRRWASHRISEQGILFVEPWMYNIEEAGLQFDIPIAGPARLLGVTQLVCDDLGQYRGSWWTPPVGSRGDWDSRWKTAIETSWLAVHRLQSLGYFGPVGIDAMRYELPGGSVGIRPLQDINARWTMGRLSLGWTRLLRPGEHGLWWHGPFDEETAARHGCPLPDRLIPLSTNREADSPHLPTSTLMFFRTRE